MSVKSVMWVVSVEGPVLLYNLLLKNEPDIVSVMSVMTDMGVVSFIRGSRSCLKSLIL